MEKMTNKQKRFCDEYLISLNATQSAIKAGYSKKTARAIARENLTKPYIKEYIEERMKQKESELIASQDEVLQMLTKIMRGQELDEEVVAHKDFGIQTVSKKNQNNIVRSAELLGRRYGLFSDKVDIKGNINISFVEDLEE